MDIVYAEIRELLRRQERKLAEARGRAGTVLAVAAFALSFLGGSILDSRRPPSRWFWVGVVLIVAGILTTLWVLIPSGRQKLLFSPEPQDLLQHYLLLPPDESKEYLAGYMAGWVEENQLEIDPLYTALRVGIIGVGAGIIVLLGHLGEVI